MKINETNNTFNVNRTKNVIGILSQGNQSK